MFIILRLGTVIIRIIFYCGNFSLICVFSLTRVMAFHLDAWIGSHVDRVEDNVRVLRSQTSSGEEAPGAAAAVTEVVLEAQRVLLILTQRILVASLQ